jgi:hypothetical protein
MYDSNMHVERKKVTPEFFIDGRRKLVLRWEKCIERQGDYVEKYVCQFVAKILYFTSYFLLFKYKICFSRYFTVCITYQPPLVFNINHHNHHISVMELGHLLTRSGLTYPEVSSKVCHVPFCQLGNSVSLPWVIYYGAFFLHVSYFSCIPVICINWCYF